MSNTNYAAALEVATRAAEAASECLLAECARGSGPRGPNGHCPADTEAENLIRGLVADAFPAWGFRGEETGYRPAADHGIHVWVVDPNDGTAAMQQGFRGSAVSIALLRGGAPVLGVVRAVNAPDDDGDRFAWAEGCGPPTRNGKPIEREPWPSNLSGQDVVLVAHSADQRPDGNLGCVSPARFRSVPSIAYRLALAAAGEGAVAVSLNGPCSWDYAAGHALVRAAGGSLLDQDGNEVTYTADGRSSAAKVFGGATGPALVLSRRDWQRVFTGGFGPARPPSGFEPSRLSPGLQVHPSELLRRAQGCLLGQFAGDALGSLVEFQAPQTIEARYPGGPRLLEAGGTWNTLAGQPTDDSELALMLARTLVTRGFDVESIAAAYARWYRGWPHEDGPVGCDHAWCLPFDIGTTTRQALAAITAEAVEAGRAAQAAAGAASRGSQANGALMRVSPIGIWGAGHVAETVADAARQDARLTHSHPVCGEASAVFAVTIAHVVANGGSPRDVYEWGLNWARSNCTEPSVTGVLEEAASERPASYTHQQGWVLIAFQNAFFQLLHAPSLEDGVIATVRAGGDTDTNGAICGALLGAVHGRDGVPSQWQRMITSCRPMLGHESVHQPRPAMFWPTDAMVLAERLLLAGSARAAFTMATTSSQ